LKKLEVVERETTSNARKPVPSYQSWFSTQHRGQCRTAAFSPDGLFFATGSEDTSLKVLDTALIKNQASNTASNTEEKKVVKTLYDHTLKVNEVTFHPNGAVLASCSGFLDIFNQSR
jgi:cleavage stimulation factor subunit 1